MSTVPETTDFAQVLPETNAAMPPSPVAPPTIPAGPPPAAETPPEPADSAAPEAEQAGTTAETPPGDSQPAAAVEDPATAETAETKSSDTRDTDEEDEDEEDEESRPRGRPTVLDAAMREKIIWAVTNGCSRRGAAKYVGCSPSTITRTADREPVFAAELARAEQGMEISLVECLRTATREPRYWRAAAWLLERINPIDWSYRDPAKIPVAGILGALRYFLSEVAPEEYAERVRNFLRELSHKRRPEEVGLMAGWKPKSPAPWDRVDLCDKPHKRGK